MLHPKSFSLLPKFLKTVFFSLFLAPALVFSQAASCDFTASTTNPCPGQTVTFTVSSPQPNHKYTWKFNPSAGLPPKTGNPVSVSFPFSTNPQTFQVMLFDTLPGGATCSDTVPVQVKAAPDPSITLVPTPGVNISSDGLTASACTDLPPITVSILNASTTIGQNVSYTIDWGDGQTQTLTNFSTTNLTNHSYTGSGLFLINITAKHLNGCEFSKTYRFYNGGKPSVGLGIEPLPNVICPPYAVKFPISSIVGNSPGTMYEIRVNDLVVKTYDQSNVPSEFTHLFTESSCGKTSTYGLDNAFYVQIKAINPCGQATATVGPILINGVPTPGIGVQGPATYCIGSQFVFENNSSGGGIVSPDGNGFECLPVNPNAAWSISPGTDGVEWKLINGNFFAASSITVKFNQVGTYHVVMTLKLDNSNNPLCAPKSATVEIVIASPPTADADVQYLQNANGCAPIQMKIKNKSALATGSIWKITTSTGAAVPPNCFTVSPNVNTSEPTINISCPGTYRIRLESSNTCGMAVWDTLITVFDKPSLVVKPLSVCEDRPLDVPAANVTVTANGQPDNTWLWQLPGGTTSNDMLPQDLIFQNPGNFVVTVTATNTCGGGQDTAALFVRPRPQLAVAVNGAGPCVPDTVSFGQTTQPGVMYIRSVTDLNDNPVPAANFSYLSGNATSPAATIIFKKSGSYRVRLVAQNSCDTIASIWQHTFFEKPSAVLPSLGPFCLSDTINFSQNMPGLTLSNGGDPNTTFNWAFQNGNPTFSNQQYPGAVFFENTSGATQTLTVSLFLENACTTTPLIFSKKFDLQVPQTITSAPLDPTYCQNHPPIPLKPTPAGTTVSGPGVSSGPGGYVFNPATPNLPTDSPLVLTYNFGNGTCSSTATDTVVVLPVPAVPSFQNQTACIENDSFPLLSLSGGKWTISAPGVLKNGGLAVDLRASGPGDFMLTLVVTATNGCTNTGSFSLKINPNTDPDPNDTTYCNVPGLVNLPLGDTPGLIYTHPNVSQPGNQFNPAGLPPGPITLPYSMTNGTGCKAEGSIVVTIVAPLPPGAVQAGPDRSICSYDNPLTLGGSPAPGVWTVSPVTPALSNSGIFDPKKATPGLYVLVYTVGGGNCAAHQTDMMLLRVVGLAPDAGTDEKACVNELPFTLTAGGGVPPGAVLKWSGNGIIDSFSGLFDPKVAGAGNHLISISLTDTASACVFKTEKNVEVNPLAGSFFEINGLQCEGQNLIFQNKTPGTASSQWWLDGVFFSNQKNPTWTATDGAHTMTLVSTTNEGCRDTFNVQFSVRKLPSATLVATSPTEGCDGLEVVFQTDTAHADEAWLALDSAGFWKKLPLTQSLIFKNTTSATLKYRVALVATSECATVGDTLEITVKADPKANFEATYLQPCSGQKVEALNISTGDPTDGYFYTSENPSLHLPANPLFPTVFQWFTDTVAKKITVSLVVWNECRRDTFSREITVLPSDVAALFNVEADTSRLCPGTTLRVTNGSTPGIPARWETSWGEKFVGDTVDIRLPDTAGFFKIKILLEGCGYDSFEMPLRVHPSPTASLTVDKRRCLGDETGFSLVHSGHSATVFFGDGDSTEVSKTSHVFSQSGDFQPFAIVTSLLGCSTRVEATTRVAPQPEFTLSLRDTCWVSWGKDLTVLTNPLNTAVLEGDTGRFHPTLPPGLYALRVVTPEGCWRDTTVAVGLPEELRVTVDSAVIFGELGVPVTLVSRVNQPGAAVVWSPGAFVSDSVSAITKALPPGDTRFIVTASNARGCTATASVFVNVNKDVSVFFPNVVAPETEGANEVWHPFTSPGILKINQLQIFDYWGELVFELNDAAPNDPTTGWRGDFRGKKLNPGVFVFWAELLRADGTTQLHEGDILLVR